ncbi:MAG: chemotaxis protein [Phycisphaerae bacterium]
MCPADTWPAGLALCGVVGAIAAIFHWGKSMAKEGILLETGTNEVEILEFDLGGQGFGVNVLKIQAIEQYDPERVTHLQTARPSLVGVFMFRGNTVPLVDLGAELGVATRKSDEPDEDQADSTFENRIVLVLEFNGVTSSVVVDGVNRIHRISWDQLSPLSTVFADQQGAFTGSVNIDDSEILIVDMEKIVAEILPHTGQVLPESEPTEHPRSSDRGDVKIVLAEDSGTIRRMLLDVLKKDGYTNVRDFDNGKSAHEQILQIIQQSQQDGRDLSEYLNMVITDIEMPQMDGLTLCKEIKTKVGLHAVPVMMFSSMINEQMARRCESVGADAYISKPQFGKLVEMVDRLCLDGQSVESVPMEQDAKSAD